MSLFRTGCRYTRLLLKLVEDVERGCSEVITVDLVYSELHRLLRQLLHLVHLELLDAHLLSVLRRRLERLEQEAAHDGVADEDGGESDVREQRGDDRLHALVATSASTFLRPDVVFALAGLHAARRGHRSTDAHRPTDL